jgi:hemerythrin-like domain-containing protein
VTATEPIGSAPKPPRGRFTIVYLIHEAFRRDLSRLRVAVRSPHVDASKARRLDAHWNFVNEQLHHHHQVEDSSLWPLVRPKLAGKDQQLEVLDKMEVQHHALEPKCEAITEEFAAYPDRLGAQAGESLAIKLEDLATVLAAHLDDEEAHCFPVIDEALSVEEFESFGKATAKAIGMRGSARFFPWIFDEANPLERNAVLSMPPPPVRILCGYVWEPRYKRQNPSLWTN